MAPRNGASVSLANRAVEADVITALHAHRPWSSIAADLGLSFPQIAEIFKKYFSSLDTAEPDGLLRRRQRIEQCELLLSSAWHWAEMGSDRHLGICAKLLHELIELEGHTADRPADQNKMTWAELMVEYEKNNAQ